MKKRKDTLEEEESGRGRGKKLYWLVTGREGRHENITDWREEKTRRGGKGGTGRR